MAKKDLQLGIERAESAWQRAKKWSWTGVDDMRAADWDNRLIELLVGLRKLPVDLFFALTGKGAKPEEVIEKWHAAWLIFQAAVVPSHLVENAEKALRSAARGGDRQAVAVVSLGGKIAGFTNAKVRYLQVSAGGDEVETLKDAVTRLLILAVKREVPLDGEVFAQILESELLSENEAVGIITKAKGGDQGKTGAEGES